MLSYKEEFRQVYFEMKFDLLCFDTLIIELNIITQMQHQL